MTPATAKPIHDHWTVIAIAILVYALSNLAHEGAGHGGTCVALGGAPTVLNAIYFDCDSSRLAESAALWISSAGTLMNLLLAGVAALVLRFGRNRHPTGRYFWTLLMMVNLFQATGYWLFSGLGGIGDWNRIVQGLPHYGLWRALLAVAGATGYWLAIRAGLRSLEPFLGGGEDRLRRARGLTLSPYLAGGALYVLAGLLNPESLLLVLISAAAASFGGTSALAWMFQLLRDQRKYPPGEAPALTLNRSTPWILAAAATALVFIAVLGPGIQFSSAP